MTLSRYEPVRPTQTQANVLWQHLSGGSPSPLRAAQRGEHLLPRGREGAERPHEGVAQRADGGRELAPLEDGGQEVRVQLVVPDAPAALAVVEGEGALGEGLRVCAVALVVGGYCI